MRGLDERVSGGRIWFQVEAFGSAFWESIPEKPVCDVSGQAMEPKALKDAVILELGEMTRLKVGRLVSEGDGRAMAHEAGTKILGCRWVYTLKSDGRHRARLVTKDFRAAGLSSLQGRVVLSDSVFGSAAYVSSVCGGIWPRSSQHGCLGGIHERADPRKGRRR